MGLFPQRAHHEATSSENLVLLHDLCRRSFEPKLLFIVDQVAVIIDVSQIKIKGPNDHHKGESFVEMYTSSTNGVFRDLR